MKQNIGLIIIATGRYHQFVPALLESARKYFLVDEKVTFYLFTDVIKDWGDDVVTIPTKHEAWPKPTLYRYKHIINSKSLLSSTDYLFYIDADSLFVDHVGKEILSDGLTVTHHPGFYSFGTGSWETNPKSRACTIYKKRYACGGFNGGKTNVFLSAASYMAIGIDEDEKNGVVAVYHDESFLNKLVGDIVTDAYWLNPSYMMVEEPEKRLLWRIDHLKPKILALKKDHGSIRN